MNTKNLKKKKFTDLFNEIFNPKFVYDDKKTELFDTLFEIKKEGKSSKFVYSDLKHNNNRLILYGMLTTVPAGPQLHNLNGDLNDFNIKKLETLKKNINDNLFYISGDELKQIRKVADTEKKARLDGKSLAAARAEGIQKELKTVVATDIKNVPNIQLIDLDQHEERKKKYTKFKNTYLKKVKEVLENYIRKVEKVEKLYEIAISLRYINDDTKLNNAEKIFKYKRSC